MTLSFIGDPEAITCVGGSCVLPSAAAQPLDESDDGARAQQQQQD